MPPITPKSFGKIPPIPTNMVPLPQAVFPGLPTFSPRRGLVTRTGQGGPILGTPPPALGVILRMW